MRNQFIYNFRGLPLGMISESSSLEESFQNATLRPILKLQNELIIEVFIEYCIKQKNTFFSLSENKKLDYIEQNIQRDTKFRNFLKGIIIAFFTIDEYKTYSLNASNLNKRMITMLIERVKSQVQLIVIHN